MSSLGDAADFSSLSGILSLSSEVASTVSAIPSSIVSLPSPTPWPTSDAIAPTTTIELPSDGTYPPMTTRWTVPVSCTWTYNADEVPRPGASGAVAWLDLDPVPGAKSLSCYPDGMFTDGRTGVFSPGTCPSGWTTVDLRVLTKEIKDDETTTAVCCSSEYQLDGNFCKRSVPTVIAVPYTYNSTAGEYDISDSTTTLYNATIAVHVIRALFKEEDKDDLGLKDEDDIGTENSPKKLPLSARIGIGVGVGVFVLLLVGAAAFFLIRRDRSRAAKKRSLELDAMRNGRYGGEGGDVCGTTRGGGRGRCGHAEPPPAYEAATDTASMTDNDSRLSGDTTTRDEEIRALRVQKAVIQRRIDELEHSETNQTEGENRQ